MTFSFGLVADSIAVRLSQSSKIRTQDLSLIARLALINRFIRTNIEHPANICY